VLRGAEFGPANIYSGIDMSVFTLIVNSKQHLLDADSEMPLLWALRDLLSLTGTKYGCGMGILRCVYRS
jgi:aerobic-type carbon monoxide dehydrogenase small subunit (CoxS/CutS family)